MWKKSHTIITKAATSQQMWKLFANVNNWHKWDEGIDYARMEGKFEKGNYLTLKPKGAPEVKITLIETVENKTFTDQTNFPLAVMRGTHIFEETPEGLRVTTTMTVEGILGFLWRKLVAEKIVDGLPKEMLDQARYASKL